MLYYCPLFLSPVRAILMMPDVICNELRPLYTASQHHNLNLFLSEAEATNLLQRYLRPSMFSNGSIYSFRVFFKLTFRKNAIDSNLLLWEDFIHRHLEEDLIRNLSEDISERVFVRTAQFLKYHLPVIVQHLVHRFSWPQKND